MAIAPFYLPSVSRLCFSIFVLAFFLPFIFFAVTQVHIGAQVVAPLNVLGGPIEILLFKKWKLTNFLFYLQD